MCQERRKGEIRHEERGKSVGRKKLDKWKLLKFDGKRDE